MQPGVIVDKVIVKSRAIAPVMWTLLTRVLSLPPIRPTEQYEVVDDVVDEATVYRPRTETTGSEREGRHGKTPPDAARATRTPTHTATHTSAARS